MFFLSRSQSIDFALCNCQQRKNRPSSFFTVILERDSILVDLCIVLVLDRAVCLVLGLLKSSDEARIAFFLPAILWSGIGNLTTLDSLQGRNKEISEKLDHLLSVHLSIDHFVASAQCTSPYCLKLGLDVLRSS